jgi:hypothetical protein
VFASKQVLNSNGSILKIYTDIESHQLLTKFGFISDGQIFYNTYGTSGTVDWVKKM